MTPAEFFAITKGRITEAKRIRNDMDALNAMQCFIAAKLAGNEKSTLEQFMIFKEKVTKSPEQLVRIMDQWAAAGGKNV